MSQNKIKQIVKLFEQSNVTKMEVEFEDIKISLEKPDSTSQQTIETTVLDKTVILSEQEQKVVLLGVWVTSPLVGTYYAASSPTSKPFVEVGQVVKKGDILCVIEAMKVMNEVKSTVDGVVVEIAVENESMVQFNQNIIRIDDNDS